MKEVERLLSSSFFKYEYLSKKYFKQLKRRSDEFPPLLWDMLPPEFEGYFEVSGHLKTETLFRIWLTEINTILENLPKKYHRKKVMNTYTREITIEDFPLRGRKGELILKRRFWKFEGVDGLCSRDIRIVFSRTKTDKEIADFRKGAHRQASTRDYHDRGIQPSPSTNPRKTVQRNLFRL